MLKFRSFLSPSSAAPSNHGSRNISPINANETDNSRRSIASTSETSSFMGDDTISIAESSSSRGRPASSSSHRNELPAPPYDESSPDEQRPRSMGSSGASTHGSTTSSIAAEDDEIERRRRRARARRQMDTSRGLHAIAEANPSSTSVVSAQSSFTPSLFGINSSYAKRMEETGRMRRLQSQQLLAPADTKDPPPSRSDITSPVSAPGPSRPRPRPESELLPAYSSPTDIAFSDILPTPSEEPEPEPQPPDVHPSPADEPDEPDPQTQLAQVLRILEETKAAMAQAAVDQEAEKEALLARLTASEQQSEDLTRTLTALTHTLSETRSELSQTRTSLTALSQEKRGWQAKLDAMHHKVQRAERAIRALDHITRAKLDAREAAEARSIRRTKHIMSMEPAPSMEVLDAVEALNEEILQLANIFVENLERTKTRSSIEDIHRAKSVVGEGMVAMVEAHADTKQEGFPFLLMLVVLEVFMTSWCAAIIDGHYPQQQSFTDLLLEMSAQSLVNASRRGHVPRIHCGHPIQVVQTNTTSVMEARFPEWVDEIIDDLAQVLLVGGLKIRSQRAQMFVDKFLGLVKMSYEIRAALAESDICGGLELCIVAPDTPFQFKWMDEGHEGQTPISELEWQPIAGTCGLGLQRHSMKGQGYSNGNAGSGLTIVMKPKVVLLSILDDP